MAILTKIGTAQDEQHIIDNRPDLHHTIENPHPLHKAIVEEAKLRVAREQEEALKLEKVKEAEANVKSDAAVVEMSQVVEVRVTAEDWYSQAQNFVPSLITTLAALVGGLSAWLAFLYHKVSVGEKAIRALMSQGPIGAPEQIKSITKKLSDAMSKSSSNEVAKEISSMEGNNKPTDGGKDKVNLCAQKNREVEEKISSLKGNNNHAGGDKDKVNLCTQKSPKLALSKLASQCSLGELQCLADKIKPAVLEQSNIKGLKPDSAGAAHTMSNNYSLSIEAIQLDNGHNKLDLIGTTAVSEDDGGNSTSGI